MDINKWKSVAIKKTDYDLLKGICKQKFRAPGAMISKLIRGHVEYEAKKQKTTVEAIEKKYRNGSSTWQWLQKTWVGYIKK